MDKKPTIKDVALHAGVSKSTVSLVLQNSPLVKEDTRESVQASMHALNYVRNRAAATLRGGGVGLIGLVINDLRNPFFTEFAASAQRVFADAGFATVVANADEDAQMQHQVIISMLEHGVSAILISPVYGDTKPSFDAIHRTNTPTLQVLRLGDPRTEHFPFYSIDYAEGSLLAVDHFLEQGLTEIAFVGGLEGRQITLERASGFLARMAEQSRPAPSFFGRNTREFGRDIAFKLLDTQPNIKAAICFNDLVALGMMSAMAQRGVVVGRDFFLIGFDDIEESSLVYPSLSSVHCDIEGFGARSARLLLDWLADGGHPAELDRAAVRLDVRQSSLRRDI